MQIKALEVAYFLQVETQLSRGAGVEVFGPK